MRVLAGDVGGTKTWLALYEGRDHEFRELRSSRFSSSAFHSLAPMIRVFLGNETHVIERAAFGVAGPVIDDVCNATNLPWRIDARRLEADLEIPRIRLINDFQAVALGVPSLQSDDLFVLQDREVDPQGPIAVIGAGTGLGEAIMVPSAEGLRVLPSEGGHTDFAPRNEIEIELLRFLLRRHERVSYERVVSGPGLVTLYEFVTTHGIAPENETIRARMGGEDPAAVIGGAALDRSDEACSRAVELFLSLYGAEAGNLALKVLPTGGLYIAGGIAPRLLPLLRGGAFLEAFHQKGRMTPLVDALRVAVITNTQVGLLGARNVAAKLD